MALLWLLFVQKKLTHWHSKCPAAPYAKRKLMMSFPWYVLMKMTFLSPLYKCQWVNVLKCSCRRLVYPYPGVQRPGPPVWAPLLQPVSAWGATPVHLRWIHPLIWNHFLEPRYEKKTVSVMRFKTLKYKGTYVFNFFQNILIVAQIFFK